jgi:hypothetical protein
VETPHVVGKSTRSQVPCLSFDHYRPRKTARQIYSSPVQRLHVEGEHRRAKRKEAAEDSTYAWAIKELR